MKFKFRLPSRLPYFGRGGKGAPAVRVAGQASKVAGKVKKSSWRGLFRWTQGLVTGSTAAVAMAADQAAAPATEPANDLSNSKPALPAPDAAKSDEKAALPEAVLQQKDGFYGFDDDYKLPAEPTVEQALERYLPHVGDFFSESYDPHPNLIEERNHEQKLVHAYDLDYREIEMSRIRNQSKIDVKVFDYIDSLVDTVMLKNLLMYVEKRDEIFVELLSEVKKSYYWVAILAVLFFAGITYYAAKWFGLQPLHFGIFAGAATAAVAVWGRGKWLKVHVWHKQSELLLKTKRSYEDTVRDAANLLASKLVIKGREIESLMKDFKNRLDQVGDVEKRRMEQAPSLVRLLLWCPMRMQLIENYYRAKVDQFMVKSARVSLGVSVRVEQAILKRETALRAGRFGLLAGLFVTLVVWLSFGNDASLSAWVERLVGSGDAPAASAGPSGAVAEQPGAVRTGGEEVAAKRDSAMSIDVSIVAVFVSLILCGLGFILTVGYSALRIVPVAHKFAPEEIAHHDEELYRSGVNAAVFGFLMPMIPTSLILLLGWDFIAVWSVYLGYALIMMPIALKERELTDLIFKRNEHLYTSNVLRSVSRKMESTQWQRYAELRADEKVAGVVRSVYGAWYAEVRKGRFDDTEAAR